MDNCHHFKDSGTTVQIGRNSFPKIGDDVAAYTATASFKGIDLTLNFVVFLQGNYIGVLLYGDVGSTDLAQVQKFVAKADALLSK